MNAKLTKQIDTATTKAEKKAKVFKRKAKRTASKYAVIAGSVIGLFLAMLAVNGLNTFYAKYELYFRSPLQNPLVFHEKILPMPTKMPTPTIVPSPSVMPVKAPVKRTLLPVAYASDDYPYESKVGKMDAGQKEVMGQIEQKLGKAYAELIFRESGFHPLSVNSSSGACGLAQALPCSKMACELTDVDCQLNWIKSYVERRYTNIDNALLFHDQKGWY